MKIIYLMSIILVLPLILLQPMAAYSQTYKDAKGTVITQDQYDVRVQYCQEMINEDIALAKEVGDCKSWVLTAIGTEMVAYYISSKY